MGKLISVNCKSEVNGRGRRGTLPSTGVIDLPLLNRLQHDARWHVHWRQLNSLREFRNHLSSLTSQGKRVHSLSSVTFAFAGQPGGVQIAADVTRHHTVTTSPRRCALPERCRACFIFQEVRVCRSRRIPVDPSAPRRRNLRPRSPVVPEAPSPSSTAPRIYHAIQRRLLSDEISDCAI